MGKPKRYRERRTGSIYKRGKNFYYKIRINGKAKTQLLLDRNDQPVTTRQEAEKAAALVQPILRAQQKEEIALYVADAKNLKKRSLIFRFGFSNGCSPNIVCSKRRISLIFVDYQYFTINPPGSDLTIYARAFIVYPVFSGWWLHVRVLKRFLDHTRKRCPWQKKVKKTRVSRHHPTDKSTR